MNELPIIDVPCKMKVKDVLSAESTALVLQWAIDRNLIEGSTLRTNS